MKKDILNTIIRFSEESRNDADAVYYPNFEKLAEELDALFAKRIVSHRRELLNGFVLGFYNWHNKQGFVTVKKQDWFDYIKTIL